MFTSPDNTQMSSSMITHSPNNNVPKTDSVPPTTGFGADGVDPTPLESTNAPTQVRDNVSASPQPTVCPLDTQESKTSVNGSVQGTGASHSRSPSTNTPPSYVPVGKVVEVRHKGKSRFYDGNDVEGLLRHGLYMSMLNWQKDQIITDKDCMLKVFAERISKAEKYAAEETQRSQEQIQHFLDASTIQNQRTAAAWKYKNPTNTSIHIPPPPPIPTLPPSTHDQYMHKLDRRNRQPDFPTLSATPPPMPPPHLLFVPAPGSDIDTTSGVQFLSPYYRENPPCWSVVPPDMSSTAPPPVSAAGKTTRSSGRNAQTTLVSAPGTTDECRDDDDDEDGFEVVFPGPFATRTEITVA